VAAVLGATHSDRIARMVTDVLAATNIEERRIRMSAECYEALCGLRDFLYARVYEIPAVRREFVKAQRILEDLFGWFVEHEDEFRRRHWPRGVPQTEPLARAVGDFLAGMTDRYALRLYDELFMPQPWVVL
jgi:dGTPase